MYEPGFWDSWIDRMGYIRQGDDMFYLPCLKMVFKQEFEEIYRCSQTEFGNKRRIILNQDVYDFRIDEMGIVIDRRKGILFQIGFENIVGIPHPIFGRMRI